MISHGEKDAKRVFSFRTKRKKAGIFLLFPIREKSLDFRFFPTERKSTPLRGVKDSFPHRSEGKGRRAKAAPAVLPSPASDEAENIRQLLESEHHMSNEYNYKEFIETIANHYGADSQIGKLAEEAEELMDAAIEYRDDPIQERREHLAEEIADVQVMVDQAVALLGIKGLVWRAQEYKLMRQLDRMKGEEGGK